MTNNNSPEIQEQKGLSLNKFRELVEKVPTAEKIKQELGSFGEEYEIKVPQTLQKEDKEKLKDYEELEIKDLPKDWRAELARIKELEKNQVDYLQKKEELKGWTDTFGEKKPEEIKSQIQQLEEKQIKTEEELNARILELETDLKKTQQEKEELNKKIEELEEKLRLWRKNFNGLDLEEVKNEWEEMKKRPDISISEEQFYNNYAPRLTLKAGRELEEKLKKTKEELGQEKEENKKLGWAISQILNSLIIQRYAVADPVLNQEQARQAIAKLLKETEQKWENYLGGEEKITDAQSLAFALSLSLKKVKRERIHQVLEWIKEARETGEYQTLFENWSGGKEYKKEYENDFDGSLFLLGKRLEVKDEDSEPQITGE